MGSLRLAGALGALAAASLAHTACAACNSTTCSSCMTDTECFEAGCADDSPGDYDREFCVAPGDSSGDGSGGGELNACEAGVVLGIFGGIFAFILPCCLLCQRRQRVHSRYMLNAPRTVVQRATARVTKYWTVTSSGESSSTTYYLTLEYQATRGDGSAAFVKVPEATVLSATYSKAMEANMVEVAYLVSNVQEFEAVTDLEMLSSAKSCMSIVMICFPIVFGSVGLGIGAASGPITGCNLGYIPFAVLVVWGVVCGQFICWPIMRKSKKLFTKQPTVEEVSGAPVMVFGTVEEASGAPVMVTGVVV